MDIYRDIFSVVSYRVDDTVKTVDVVKMGMGDDNGRKIKSLLFYICVDFFSSFAGVEKYGIAVTVRHNITVAGKR